jgi:phenylacetate-CoA ligase
MTALQYQHSWRVGMRPGHHFAHSWPGGLYPTAVLGGRHFLDLGILEIPVGPPFTPEQAASHVLLWQTLGIDALMCTGSQLLTYDDAASSMGVDLADVLSGARLVIVEASCQFEAPRARIERTYGVKIHNISGAAEVLGFVTSDCEHHTGLHVPVGHHVIQVCDPVTGREVPDGERGTLVASSFDMDAYCLRYDLEDIVVGFSDPCPCGQVGKRYQLLGRAVDRAVVSGRSILPIDVQLALEPLGAPEFLLQAGACDELTVRVESDAAPELQKGLEESLGVPVRLDPVAEGSLPRAAFKPRRILQ